MKHYSEKITIDSQTVIANPNYVLALTDITNIKETHQPSQPAFWHICISATTTGNNIKYKRAKFNPSNEVLNITHSNQISFYQIFQFEGKVVERGNTFSINISNYSRGLLLSNQHKIKPGY